MKRLVDIVIATTALILLLPIFIWVTYKVKKNLGSPVLFLQERPGENGQIFKMIKFQSMKDAVDKDGNPLPDEKRITPFGQKLRSTSLDEMPQLINVLKGDMSIVGPRPDLPEHFNVYSESEKRKLSVRPGITGYNQAYFRNTIPWKERIQNDIYYIDHLSFWMDIRVVFKTAWSILSRKSVFIEVEEKNEQ